MRRVDTGTAGHGLPGGPIVLVEAEAITGQARGPRGAYRVP